MSRLADSFQHRHEQPDEGEPTTYIGSRLIRRKKPWKPIRKSGDHVRFSTKVLDATEKNRRLLYELSQTDYAAPALKQNTAYIAELTQEIAKADKELTRLGKITQDERKDHTDLESSVVKRFAYKLGGHKGKDKFASKQEKEEREFLEAWQREREAKEHREELARAMEKAQSEKRTQEGDKNRHDKAQVELNQMYNSIFSGPTPDVPAEDQMEQAVKNATDWFQQCEMQTNNEIRALEGLKRATHWLNGALQDMASARQASQFDMFGGGTFTDMMERNSLSRAQNNLSQALRSMDEVRRSQPNIQQLTPVTIDNAHIISDVLFDNIFTDYAQHQRIENSLAQMQQAWNQLGGIVKEQARRVQQGKTQLTQAVDQLEDARKELQLIRSEAFERFASQGSFQEPVGGEEEAPPAYRA